MDTVALVQQEEKADCQNPKDESSTNSKLQPIVPVNDGGLVIGRSKAQVECDTETNPEALETMKEKADCQNPKDESSTNSKLQPIVQVKNGELVIVRPRAQVEYDMKANLETREKMKQKLFPWAKDAPNDLNKVAQSSLFYRYSREHENWSDEMRKEFHVVAPTMDYSMGEENIITDHPICTEASTGSATWIHAWFLQVLFGRAVCEGQSWIEDLKKEYPALQVALSSSDRRGVFFLKRIIDCKRRNDLECHNKKIQGQTQKIIENVKNHDDEEIRRLLENKPHMEADLAKAIQDVLSSHFPVKTVSYDGN
ncbi:uncharacterized protein Triagg1_8754 [Trichoderma aggressivum f. europaeum]|uniref:Uncharacterized protein n=1 Tax=Trichoderma aggressivum f. europaeum TaxID=173218 RepID=A0AAE1LVW6_9HYPO|nr:hypothetical protein Triagg1_8754 [Trichoderma aggressivum f. europaeum]